MEEEKNNQIKIHPRYTPKRWGILKRLAYLFLVLTIPVILSVLYKFKYEGIENVPEEGTGVILTFNHQSFLDPFFVATALSYLSKKHRLILWFGSKKVMSKRYFQWVKWGGAFPVDTEGGGRGMAQSGVDYSAILVKDGFALAIALEGKRSGSGKFLRPRAGLGRIAHTSKGIVVPIYLHNVRDAWRPGKKNPGFRIPVFAKFGKPLSFKEEYEQPLDLKIARRISTKTMREIRRIQRRFLKESS